MDVAREFGPIDIYLFDQILRGRIVPGMRIFDAGCGGGRNLVYFLRAGYEVAGADADPKAVAQCRAMAQDLVPGMAADSFRVETLDSLTFEAGWADVVISSAVLHFAADDAAFQAMLEGTWRMVRPGGMLFCRLASTIGIEAQARRMRGRWHLLPDGSERYLVDEAMLVRLTDEMGGLLLDPIKTTVVQGQRAMTTWVVGKGA